MNLLIKQAEASSLAEDEAIGGRVVLEGDNWQEAARWEGRAGGKEGVLWGVKERMRVACLFARPFFCRATVSVGRSPPPLLWTGSGRRGWGAHLHPEP